MSVRIFAYMHWHPHFSLGVYAIFQLIYTYSYIILFPLVVVEGPVITVIAGFLASTGFLDPIPAYATVIAANMMGDILYYAAGRWWFNGSIKKLTEFFKISPERIDRIQDKLKTHSGKVLFFGKLSHVFGGLILVASGKAEISIRKFLFFCFLAEVPKSIILMAVGYFFGSTISNFGRYVNFTFVGLIILTLIMIGIYIGVSYVSNKFFAKSEK